MDKTQTEQNEQIGSTAGMLAGALTGARAGSVLIPVPFVGTFLGALAGGAAGSAVGKRLGAAALNAASTFVDTLMAPSRPGTAENPAPSGPRRIDVEDGSSTPEEPML